MARTDIQMNIRIPAGLKAKIEAAAAESGRSLTVEIVQRLETSFLVDKQSAFEMLKKGIEVIESSEEALKGHEEDIARFVAGDKGALKWLGRTDYELSDEEITSAARQVADVFRDEIKKARSYVPVLISTVKDGGPIPEEIRRFLSRA